MDVSHFFNRASLWSGCMIALAAIMGATPAAAITCKSGFQLVQGNYISTPYCQDAYLTIVARSYGMRVSAAEIRNNPNYKRQVCRFVGRDIRVQETCLNSNAYGRRGF
jgi:hypothetical protein